MPASSDFTRGTKDGIPIALGYIPVAIAFGVLAGAIGLPAHLAVIMSLLVFAGASQFIALNLLQLGTDVFSVVFTTFVVNLRHFLMSASLAERLKGLVPRGAMTALFLGLTDETFSLLSLSERKKLSSGYILGVNLTAYLSWVGGTFLGAYLGAGLPEIITSSMGITLYAMFIALLIPRMKASRAILIMACLAMLISSALTWLPGEIGNLSPGWKIIISTTLASLVGALFFPGEHEEEEQEKGQKEEPALETGTRKTQEKVQVHVQDDHLNEEAQYHA